MEKLTIQQLAPYLPYGLIGVSKRGTRYILDTSTNMKGSGIEVRQISTFIEDDFKLELYPISCLTKTIQHEGREFCPIVELLKELIPDSYAYVTRDASKNGDINGAENIKGLSLRYVKDTFILSKGKQTISFNQYQLFQKLAEWQINFNGISEGQYIDKETLK